MSKVTTMLTAGLLIVLAVNTFAAPENPRFGYFMYKGPTSIDVYVPQLTDAEYSKAEFFVNGKKLKSKNKSKVREKERWGERKKESAINRRPWSKWRTRTGKFWKKHHPLTVFLLDFFSFI